MAYLRSQIAVSTFSAKFKEKTNSQNINVSFQDDTDLPFDKAAQFYNIVQTLVQLDSAIITDRTHIIVAKQTSCQCEKLHRNEISPFFSWSKYVQLDKI